jgi:hypothetical protein
MLNPFFLQGSSGEQGLIQDLINEQIRMYGVEVYYLPRKYVTKNTVIEEVIRSKFDISYPIEAYVDSYDGYGGPGSLLSKFGIQDIDDLTLVISKERFESYITPLSQNLPNIELASRPKEGDLIYFPLGDRLFEIKYVEHEKPFYQLQKNYVYELRCELFRYEDEEIDTSINYIDDNIQQLGYIQTLTLVGVGTTATAVSSVYNGAVKTLTITQRGGGYTSSPNVKFSASLFGRTAVGIATMIGNLVNCEGDNTKLKVQGVEITDPGYGYATAPGVLFNGGGGVGAAATTTIANGVVGIITLTNGGSGYPGPPTVTFSSPVGGGVTAIARAYVTAGIVTAIRIVDGGSGYTTPPTIIIESPYSAGLGTFFYNETVTGTISSTTGVVRSWNAATNTLQIANPSGDWSNGELVIGNDSRATYKLIIINTDNVVDPYYENDTIETEADQILDFSERNPFGIP